VQNVWLSALQTQLGSNQDSDWELQHHPAPDRTRLIHVALTPSCVLSAPTAKKEEKEEEKKDESEESDDDMGFGLFD